MKKKKTLQLFQFILAIILNLLLIFTASDLETELLILKGKMLIIPVLLWLIMLAIFCFETKFKTSKVRMIYLIITSFLMALVTDDFELTAAASMVFSIPYLIMMLIVCFKGSKDVKVEGKKTLQVGHFSKKHSMLTYVYFVVGFVVAFILFYFLRYVLEVGIVLSVVIVFVVVFLIIIFSSYYCNPFIKILNNFNKNIDFYAYERGILELLNNNLHADSTSYLMLMYVNYMYLVDKEKAFTLFEEITRPEFKSYKLYYYLISIINAINKKDEENAIKLFDFFKSQYPKQKVNIDVISRAFVLYFSSGEIENVKTFYPINKGSLISRIINANVLAYYYQTRNNLSEAKLYAKFVIENANGLSEITNHAKEILETN